MVCVGEKINPDETNKEKFKRCCELNLKSFLLKNELCIDIEKYLYSFEGVRENHIFSISFSKVNELVIIDQPRDKPLSKAIINNLCDEYGLEFTFFELNDINPSYYRFSFKLRS